MADLERAAWDRNGMRMRDPDCPHPSYQAYQHDGDYQTKRPPIIECMMCGKVWSLKEWTALRRSTDADENTLGALMRRVVQLEEAVANLIDGRTTSG